MTGDDASDAPALSRAKFCIAVEGATDATCSAADIVLTKPGLLTIVHAIGGSRIIFQRTRDPAIYACAVPIRIVVCFAILAFAFLEPSSSIDDRGPSEAVDHCVSGIVSAFAPGSSAGGWV